jgi:glutamyl-tRNA synthetase
MSDAAYFTEMEAKIPTGKVRTRFAPSPTGYMHIGNLRTALYTWLIARSHGGTFILRIEDTDQERFQEGALDIIYRTLKETGLVHDEGPDKDGGCDQGRLVEGATDVIYRTMTECHLNHDEGPDIGGPVAPYIQSQRRDTYGKYARLLAEKGGAYYCFCEKCASEEDTGDFDRADDPCRWRTRCAARRRASLTSSASASPRRGPPRFTMPCSEISPWKTAPWMTRYC